MIRSTIGEVSKKLGVSAHTLRYCEKIKLLPPVSKTESGRREYNKDDVSRVQFIKRAQRMHFSLEEIRALLDLDRARVTEKSEAQKLVKEKLVEIEEGLADLKRLKGDLNKMLSDCLGSTADESCPIIEGIKQTQ